MIENPLKEVLAKRANLLDMFALTPVGPETSLPPSVLEDFYNSPTFTETLQTQINPIKERSFRDGAELIEYLLKDPDSIRYLDDVQDLLGKDVKLQDVLKTERSLNDFARDRIYHRYGLQNYSADQLSKLNQSDKDRLEQEVQRYVELVKNKLTPSLRSSLEKAHKNSQVPTQNPLGEEITGDLDLNTEVSDEDAFANAVNSSLAELGQYGNEEDEGDIDFSVEDPDLIAEQVSIATPAFTPAQAQIPAETATATPATTAKPAKTKTPAGLTREETMQFLEQGYVPTSNGGFMLHEQQAANMLKRMQQSPDYNPGQVITDPSRLGRIRNNMLGNYEHTAQGRQEAADDMVYQKAMYHKNRQAEIDARNNAALEQYRGQLTEDTRTDYLRRGELDYQRSVLNGTPLTPAAQYYQAYSNAEIDGKPAPALPTQVQQNIDQGMHKFRGQLAAPQKPVASAPVNPRNPNYITQREMAAYSSANNSGQQAVNTVGSWDPNRLKAAQERHNKAISGNVQPVQPNTATPASTPSSARTVNPLPAGQPSSPASASTGTTSKQTPADASA